MNPKIALDLLQNPPLTQVNHHLISRHTQNISPISQATFVRNQNDLKILSSHFGGESGGNFGFESGDFLELFLRLSYFPPKSSKNPMETQPTLPTAPSNRIGFAISNHNQAYQAYKLAKNICSITPIIPDKDSALITSLPDCQIFILPHINQDLLTQNPIAKLKAQKPDALFIIDISYTLAMGMELDFSLDDRTIFLCDGESLGFLRGYGIFLSTSILVSIFPPVRYIDGFYRAIFEEITQRLQTPTQEDFKNKVFGLLREELGKDAQLFAPLDSICPNALPLRLKKIRARNLIQSLYLDGISAINGQECLFGFSSPSFVLQEMGYTQDEARELLSLSFEEFSPQTFKKLASNYKMIKQMEL